MLKLNIPLTLKNRIKGSSTLQLICVSILLLPLFFINVKGSHDWGGDFAQYIQQAINIIEGKPQFDTHYVFNPDYALLAPPTYPVGFPVLLAPVYAMFGNSIMAFTLYISFIVMLAMLMTFRFLKHYFNFYIALTATLLFAYNPWVLYFKGEVLSDFPFALFVIAGLLLFIKNKDAKRKYLNALFIGVFIGYSMLIKSIGVVLLLAIVMEVLISAIINKEKMNIIRLKFRFKLLIVTIVSSLGIYIIFSTILFPAKHESYSFFSSLFNFEDLGNTLLTTSDYYIRVFQKFFHPNTGKWNFAPVITKAFALSFFVLGLLQQFTHKIRVKEIFILIYIGVIFSFPNTTQGFRYLLPVFPLMFYYMILGVSSIRLKAKIKGYYIAFFILIVVGLQYKNEIARIVKQKNIVLNGPQHYASKELFEFIESSTNETDRFVFIKPRVLGLYASRDCYTNNEKVDKPSAEKQLLELGYDYILISKDLKNKPLSKYVEKHKYDLLKVFHNKKFDLYKKKDKIE